MNMKKIRNQIQVFLMLVTLIFAGATPSYAIIIKGPTVKVIMKDGMKKKGELLAISERTLILFNSTANQELRVNIDEVTKLTVQYSKFGKGVINGGIVGLLAAMLKLAGDNSDFENEFRSLVISSPVILGMIIGAIPKEVDNYHPPKMPAPHIDALLAKLRTLTRKDMTWEKASANGWLGRFRISWRPFFNHKVNMNINGNIQVQEGPDPSDKQLKGLVKIMSKTDIDGGTHVGRIRVDYVLHNNFSLGLEFVSLGNHYIRGGASITMLQNQKEYSAPFYFYGKNKASVGLVGVDYDIRLWESLSNLRIETGFGLSFMQIELGTANGSMLERYNTYNIVNPAFQASLSLDFYPKSKASTGMYVSFMYAPASFPAIKENYMLNFKENDQEPTVFTREGMLNIPKSNFSMGGISLGFFLRFR